MITEREKGILEGYTIIAPQEIKNIIKKIPTNVKPKQLKLLDADTDSDTPIGDFLLELKLPSYVRIYNCLRYGLNVNTVGDLTTKSYTDILNAPNMGKITLKELRTALRDKNIILAE